MGMIDYTTWTKIELVHKRAELRDQQRRDVPSARYLSDTDEQIERISLELERREARVRIAAAVVG